MFHSLLLFMCLIFLFVSLFRFLFPHRSFAVSNRYTHCHVSNFSQKVFIIFLQFLFSTCLALLRLKLSKPLITIVFSTHYIVLSHLLQSHFPITLQTIHKKFVIKYYLIFIQKLTSPACDEELLFSSALCSLLLFRKSGTLELTIQLLLKLFLLNALKVFSLHIQPIPPLYILNLSPLL